METLTPPRFRLQSIASHLEHTSFVPESGELSADGNMGGMSRPQPGSAAERLRQMLADTRTAVFAPGVYDGISARVALKQGFDCLYMTGAGTSMSCLGMPDLGLCNGTDMVRNAGMIASLDPSIPVIADADMGYGGPLNVAHTVRQYARAGVAGLHIEDQVVAKRCGHLAGKTLITREEYANHIRAACKARDEGTDIVVIARSDARNADGGGFNESVARLRIAAEIGADALFFEALANVEECRKAISLLPRDIPVLINIIAGGKTPVISFQEAQEIGFRIVIWPFVGLEGAVPALEHSYKALKKTGKPSTERPPMGPSGLFDVCGLQDLMAFDAAVGGKAFRNGV